MTDSARTAARVDRLVGRSFMAIVRAGTLSVHSFFFHGEQLFFVDALVTTNGTSGNSNGLLARLVANRHGNKCSAARSVVFAADDEVEELSVEAIVSHGDVVDRLEDRLAAGHRIAFQDGRWILFSADGNGVICGRTLRDMLSNLRFCG